MITRISLAGLILCAAGAARAADIDFGGSKASIDAPRFIPASYPVNGRYAREELQGLAPNTAVVIVYRNVTVLGNCRETSRNYYYGYDADQVRVAAVNSGQIVVYRRDRDLPQTNHLPLYSPERARVSALAWDMVEAEMRGGEVARRCRRSGA